MNPAGNQVGVSRVRHGALVPLHRFCPITVALLLLAGTVASQETISASSPRPPANDADLHYWLENMALYHRFSVQEMVAATGLSSNEVAASLIRFDQSWRRGLCRSTGRIEKKGQTDAPSSAGQTTQGLHNDKTLVLRPQRGNQILEIGKPPIAVTQVSQLLRSAFRVDVYGHTARWLTSSSVSAMPWAASLAHSGSSAKR
jgi:hypothetical protein